jgi:hypothetical protein
MSKLKQKATRLLKNLQFSSDTHNVSLVGPEVGSGANQTKVLLLKQTVKQPEQTIELKKALEQVTVKLSMEEFLRKFFFVWSEDATLLTKLLGYQTEDEYELANDMQEDKKELEQDMKEIQDRLAQFTLMKSMNEGSVSEISKSAFDEIVALQQKLEPTLIEYIETKEKQMDEIQLAKAALTAKEAELAQQVELVKSLEAKVAELEQAVAVQKAAEEKAQFEAFAEQLKGLVAEDKFEVVAKAMFEMNKVNAEVVAVQIDAMKAAKMAADVALQGLTQEQTHAEVQNSADAEKARKADLVKAAYDKQAKRK